MKHFTLSSLLAVCCLLPTSGGAQTGEDQQHDLAMLPKYQTPYPVPGSRIWHISWNLGPTGARGWVYGDLGHSNESREILIKSIEPGSPADGVLEVYDVIVGAAVPPDAPAMTWKQAPEVKPFDSDARLSFARAITWAESDMGKGELKLLVARNGEAAKLVTVHIPVMGTYVDAMPMDCPKSQKIVKEAAAYLAENTPAPGFSKGVGEPFNAVFLIATHNPAYLDQVRRSALQMSERNTISTAGHETWRWGNTNLFLSEYYLATGDERVLPSIREFSQRLNDGQCNPGTWGHRIVPDFIPPGYGSVNSTGVICFLSLILAEQCGIDVADKAIENSIGFYGSFVGRGSIPYGDHGPDYKGTTSNGKNGVAAVAFYLLGGNASTQWFGRLCASSDLRNFESGHSGNYFNQTWTPLGVLTTGDQNYINFWKRFHSHRDLARCWDGSFITQPEPHGREGDLGFNSYVSKGTEWSTGSYALSCLAGSRRLGILGRAESVFGTNPPSELALALLEYRAKDFSAASELAAQHISSSNSRLATLAAQLKGAASRNLESIELTLASMQKNLEAGDLYTLYYQLDGIHSVVSENDSRLQPFRDALSKINTDDLLAAGGQFDRGAVGKTMTGNAGFVAVLPTACGENRSWLEKNVSSKTPIFAKKAAALLEKYPSIPLAAGDTIAGVKTGTDFQKDQEQSFNTTFEVVDPVSIDDLWLNFKSAKTLEVALNGVTILDTTFIKPTGNTKLLLKPITRELIKVGGNRLEVVARPSAKDFMLDLKTGKK